MFAFHRLVRHLVLGINLQKRNRRLRVVLTMLEGWEEKNKEI